jgi:hypothetical protein
MRQVADRRAADRADPVPREAASAAHDEWLDGSGTGDR